MCKSILHLSIYVSCIWSMCAPPWCVPHRPDKCTKLKILLLNGSLAEKRSSPKWWMMPWHSRTHTLTQTHSHRLTHADMTPQSTGRWMKWLSDILCCLAKGLLKFSRGEVLLDSSNRFRLPASSLKARFKDFSLSRRWYVASSTTVWQYPLGLGRVNGWGVLAQVAKVEHNFYHGIHHINNSVNIFNKPQIKTTKH